MIYSTTLRVSPPSCHVSPRVSTFSTCLKPTKVCVRSQGRNNPVPKGSLGIHNHRHTISASMTTTKFQQLSSVGIGISEFLEGKNYFVTGATGLLAKVFVEKILRMSPNVGKIYLLIRAENEQSALSRLIGEIIECEAFQQQRRKHGAAYEKFMLSKLIPVVGDIREPNLGIRSAEMMNRIIEEVDVFVHSAASTDFEDRYDDILKMNVTGTSRTLELAKSCKKLGVFLHVSTAFVHGTREGSIPEEIQESLLGNAVDKSISEENDPLSLSDVDKEIKLSIDMAKTLPKNKVSLKMREMGMARAKFYGFKNTYELSKAMGELVIHRSRGKFPIVVLRPSIIESTYEEPFPGWIQGNKVAEPVIIWYGKGQLPCVLAQPEATLDIVPLDIVVNAMVAAMANHGKSSECGLFTYHITSSNINPLTTFNLFKICHSHFTFAPLVDPNGSEIRVEEMKFVDSVDEFRSLVEKAVVRKSMINDNGASVAKKNERIVENISHVGILYAPYLSCKVRFDNSNTDKLIGEMSEKEMLDFPMDVRKIDWKHYFMNIHIPGVRKHVMKKPMKSHEHA